MTMYHSMTEEHHFELTERCPDVSCRKFVSQARLLDGIDKSNDGESVECTKCGKIFSPSIKTFNEVRTIIEVPLIAKWNLFKRLETLIEEKGEKYIWKKTFRKNYPTSYYNLLYYYTSVENWMHSYKKQRKED